MTIRRFRTTNDAGFTLLELLVSLALLGLLSLVLFGGLQFGRRVWEGSEAATEATNHIRVFQHALSDEIARLYPEFVDMTVQTPAHVAFEGGSDRMTFLSPDPVTGGLLIRTVKPDTDGGTTRLVEATRLELGRDNRDVVVDERLPAIASMRLAYFGSDKPGEPATWHDSWSDRPNLPQLVRVSVNFVDKRWAWPPLIMAPRIEADVSCTFDPMTRTCAGR